MYLALIYKIRVGCAQRSVQYLQLNPRLCHGPEGVGLPVDLLHLLPHHHVEAGRVLVAEDKACVVVVRYRVHMKRPFKVHSAERSVAWIETIIHDYTNALHTV